MKQQVLDTYTLDGLENIVAFLKSHNIEYWKMVKIWVKKYY